MWLMELVLYANENTVQIHSTQLSIKNILHKRSQTQKNTYYIIPNT